MKKVHIDDSTRKDILKNLLKRSPSSYSEYEAAVQEIINNVKENGDQALFDYAKKFDHVELTKENIRVSDEEIENAYSSWIRRLFV